MRAVTLSDKAVAAFLNENCVSTWVNRNPKFHNCEFSQEARIAKLSAFATKNFCTFFVTPDLDVLHYFSGYFSPSQFLHEARFAVDLWKAVADEKGALKRDWAATYRAHHAKHAAEHAADTKRVQAIKPPGPRDEGYAEHKKYPEEFRWAKDSMIEGLRYLDRVHEVLPKSCKNGRPVALSKVITRYQGGNEFTEE